MKMTRIEKRFVNRKKKSQRNINILERGFKYIDIKKVFHERLAHGPFSQYHCVLQRK